jgi:hypothetical protein
MSNDDHDPNMYPRWMETVGARRFHRSGDIGSPFDAATVTAALKAA